MGLISLVGALLSFTLSTALSIARTYRSQGTIKILDLEVIPGIRTDIVLENFSDKTIFVDYVIFYLRGGTSSISIKANIEAHKIASLQEEFQTMFTPSAASAGGKLPESLSNHISMAYQASDKAHCILPRFDSKTNPQLAMEEEHYRHNNISLDMERAEAILFFTNPDTGVIDKQNEEIVTSFVLLPQATCDSSGYKVQ